MFSTACGTLHLTPDYYWLGAAFSVLMAAVLVTVITFVQPWHMRRRTARRRSDA